MSKGLKKDPPREEEEGEGFGVLGPWGSGCLGHAEGAFWGQAVAWDQPKSVDRGKGGHKQTLWWCMDWGLDQRSQVAVLCRGSPPRQAPVCSWLHAHICALGCHCWSSPHCMSWIFYSLLPFGYPNPACRPIWQDHRCMVVFLNGCKSFDTPSLKRWGLYTPSLESRWVYGCFDQ